jgi:hypothetical protein
MRSLKNVVDEIATEARDGGPMTEPKTLDEIAERTHTALDEEACISPGCESCAVIRAALTVARDLGRADERKALRGDAVLLRDDESDPDFDRICNDRVAGWKAGLCEFLAALDARETVRNATPSAENGQADNPDALRSQILCLEARLEERRKLFASLLAALDAREKESR